MYIKKSLGEKIFDTANVLLLILLVILTLYPCWYVLVASVSNPVKIYDNGGLLFLPVDFNIGSYLEVVKNSQLWVGYRNTIFYVVTGTFLSVALTSSAAFCASRKDLPGKNGIMFMILLTMYFSGGLIPTYLVVKSLKMLDTPWAMILPQAVTTYNLIITLSYFKNIPDSMEEAAIIDGAGPFRTFISVMLPLAKPIIAVISLYYAVSMWNNYFSALIYLRKKSFQPLQLILREILVQNNASSAQAGMSGATGDSAAYAANIKYATVVVSTVPILCIYPLLQKYLVKGVMIGAIKG